MKRTIEIKITAGDLLQIHFADRKTGELVLWDDMTQQEQRTIIDGFIHFTNSYTKHLKR